MAQAVFSATVAVHSADNAITRGSWAHVLVTYDGSLADANKLTIYVNGADVTDRSDVYDDGTLGSANTNRMEIGGNSNNADFFNGSLDDVRVYNRVLSKDEIKRLYNAGR